MKTTEIIKEEMEKLGFHPDQIIEIQEGFIGQDGDDEVPEQYLEDWRKEVRGMLQVAAAASIVLKATGVPTMVTSSVGPDGCNCWRCRQRRDQAKFGAVPKEQSFPA